MRVAKWGNSLAVRLSAELVREMKLKPGEKIEIRRAGPRALEIEQDCQEQAEREKRMKAIARLRELSAGLPKLPEGYKFSRDEIYGEKYRGVKEETQS